MHSTAAIAGARLDAAALQDWCTALPQLPQLPAARYPAAGPLITTRAERGSRWVVRKNLLKRQQPLHVTRTTRGFLEGVDTELAPIELGSREGLSGPSFFLRRSFQQSAFSMKPMPAHSAAEPADAVDCCDILRSPLCRTCSGIVLIGAAALIFAPTTAALLAWSALPDFESSAVLPGLFTLSTGVMYQHGDDWSFECIKHRWGQHLSRSR